MLSANLKTFIKTLLLSFFICLVSFLKAQQINEDSINRIKISDIYIQGGMYSQKTDSASFNDFRVLAPISELLNKDFSEFEYRGRYYRQLNGTFSIILGINIPDKKHSKNKINTRVRMGFTYLSGMRLFGNLYKREVKPYDTLTSSQTGELTYIDSVIQKSYNIEYSMQQIYYDASIIFRTNPKYLITLYTGLGISAGFSFNSKTNIVYSESRDTRERDTTHNYNYHFYDRNFSDNIHNETYSNKNSYSLSAYIPIGLDYRLAKKNRFWKKVQLCGEIRPGINLTNIPELYKLKKVGVHGLFGIRYTINS